MTSSKSCNVKILIAAIAFWLIVAGFEGVLFAPILLLLPGLFFVFVTLMALSGYLNRPSWLCPVYALSIIILVLLWLIFRDALAKQSPLSLIQFIAIPGYTFAGLMLVKFTWQYFQR
jgi:high-affinity Fe2+/Pb2+ permease